VTTTDPILKQLVADADAAEGSIPLTLYLPSGRLFGHTTTHDDFGRYCNFQLEQQSGTGCVVTPTADDEYVHLSVRNSSQMASDDDLPTVVRVRLADVFAWSAD
jgi:hypothetical protein